MGKATYTINTIDSNMTGKVSDVHSRDTENNNVRNAIDVEKPEAGKFRTILPQILASTAKNFLLLDLGMSVAFPTIVIPALRGLKYRDPSETLEFSAVQASWFASIAYICQPLGSILSGVVLEPLGRKRSMILVNIPHIIGWLMLYNATSLNEIYIAAVLLGLGVGFMEAPIVTYVGEICQPSIRGILTSCAGVAVMLGFFIVYLLGTVMVWRNIALVCVSIPLITIVAICFVPETPLWLLSKNRTEEALQSLQWLRGWVSPAAVDREFKDIQRYSENSNKCTPCQKAQVKCEHPPDSAFVKLKELTRKRTMKPFILIMVYFAITQFSGMHGMRPYLVQIFQAYNLPIDASYATVVIGVLGLLANIVCMSLIKFVGKRKLSLYSITITSLSCLSLAFYAKYMFPPGWTSFDKHENIHLAAANSGLNYIPMILFFMLAFFTSVGLAPVPWILLSELFPFKSRGIASGITAGLNYVLAFISTKTYFNLEYSLSLFGVILLYGVIGMIGFFFVYFYLPETEKRTLEDIEIHFSDNKRKWTDIYIVCNSAKNKTEIPTIASVKKGCDNKAFVDNNI